METALKAIAEIRGELDGTIKTARDDQLIAWKDDQKSIITKLDKITEKYHECLKFTTTSDVLKDAIEDLGKKYNLIISSVESFKKELKTEMNHRELNKSDLIKESKLNIKLSKFSGFDSELDIYSFQSEFEKLYLRTTTRRLLPDLLVNNHLSEPALSVVKNIDDISEIWARLKATYGDTKMLLSKKIACLDKQESLSKTKEPEKIVAGLCKLTNTIRDLMSLATKHHIEMNLFYGDGLERIYMVMGDARLTKWLEYSVDFDLHNKTLWSKLIGFLEKEIKVQQQKTFIGKERCQNPTRYKSSTHLSNINDKCHICGAADGESDHIATNGPRGIKLIQYFSCRTFVEKTPAQRFSLIRKRGFCFQCLFPGANWNKGNHNDGKCQQDFACPHPSHSKYPKKKHVLLCEEHKECKENEDLLNLYKSKYIEKIPGIPAFCKELRLSFHSNSSYSVKIPVHDENIRGIYMFQAIKLNGELFNIFFDTGCSDFLITKDAVNRLGSHVSLLSNEPVTVSGVGGAQTNSSHGLYRINLPLIDGEIATMSGICLTKLTDEFPQYPLAEAEKDLREAAGNMSKVFPKLPKNAGGKVDIMIGIRYMRYQPKAVFQSKTGLTVLKSVFRGADGTTGVLGGPHESFSRIHNLFSSSFFIVRLPNDKVPLLTQTTHSELISRDTYHSHSSNLLKSFENTENTGSQITYRCVSCRDCKACKKHDSIEAVSLKEEAEQAIINASVTIDLSKSITTARLPFISNPIARLAPNKATALKVYEKQVKKLNNPLNVKDKADVLQSEAKLQRLGFVDYVRNLSEESKLKLRENQIQNYIAWRVVWKSSSVSTPCRVVFDASMQTPSGCSLNDILAKGKNGLNRLQDIVIRWSTHLTGIHTDISKMYNTIRLDEQDWCFQRYIWQADLDPSKIPEEKVIKTLIYGVRPSGNQAEYGLRKVAELSSGEFPEASKVIRDDIFVDDCFTGERTVRLANKRSDEIELIVNKGGYKLKAVTISGQDPTTDVSDDGKSLIVAGLRWFPKDDMISLNIGELNFSKNQRGKKSMDKVNVIPARLTRRDCASKVGEVYDLLGRITPITASFKLDLHDLTLLKLDWNDVIPEELHNTWLNNFKIMQDLNSLSFRRCIVPQDAESLEIETIDTADASPYLACSAIYARIKRRNGTFSCQLVFARSKILPDRISQPRAEMIAALLNAHTGEVVKRAFGPLHKSSIKLSDSQVVLHWVNNDDKPLKQWVRNRVIEVRRFTILDDWYYVNSKNMIADLGTRRGVSINDVSADSTWVNGFDWMSGNKADFPITAVKDLKLNQSDLSKVHQETYPVPANPEHYLSNFKCVPDEVKDRYSFSKYVIDPNQFRFSKVVRILAFMLKFVSNCQKRVKKIIKPLKVSSSQSLSNILSTEDIKKARNYFFMKCTDEIKQFVPRKKYEKLAKLEGEILVYTGRLLSCDDISITGKFTTAMKDLSTTTFCVPVIDKHSPVAYAIVNEVHWYDDVVKHRGIETTLRSVLKQVYILEARSIVKSIKRTCQRCRYLEKKTLQVAMGPIPPSSVTIAPAFYVTQVDLAGPFKAFSPHNKRATIKIWLVVFCCCTTSATSIKVMDDYSTPAFVQAFIRFSSDAGFPKKMLCDEGSQLVKGCKAMKLNFTDALNKLNQDIGIEFDTCPVGGHNFHGKVERKIKEINASLERSISNDRLSLLQWETLVAKIANSINNLPIAIKNEVSDFEAIDLLTPNRLRLGRNNDRSPEGQMVTVDHPDKILEANEKVYNSWFEVWLLSHVPKILAQEKWFESDKQPSKGDIVLFLKQESGIVNTKYQYGMIEEVECSADGIARKAIVQYRNNQEKSFRSTKRSIRSLVLIRSTEETDIMTELGTMACCTDVIKDPQLQ